MTKNSPSSIFRMAIRASIACAMATAGCQSVNVPFVGNNAPQMIGQQLPPEQQPTQQLADAPAAIPAGYPMMMAMPEPPPVAIGGITPPARSQSPAPVQLASHRQTYRTLHDPAGPELHYCSDAECGVAGGGCNCGGGCQDGSCGETCGPEVAPAANPWDRQEYIIDGGDKEPLVTVRNDRSVNGLQVEDTVMHYDTVDGRTFVEPSCKTKIYAPRFAAVRKIVSPVTSEGVLAAKGTIQPNGPFVRYEYQPSNTAMQGVQAKREDGVKLVEQFRDRNRGVPAESVVPPIAMYDAVSVVEDLDLTRLDLLLERQLAALSNGIAAAKMWGTADQVEVVIDGQEAQHIIDNKAAQEIHLYEIRDKYRVRICKVASDTIANPGDIVTFSIRFDNAGDQKVANAVILDNLSPRLEYVDGSQKSSVKVRFSTSENDVGSVVLRWELEEDLKVGEGGWIRFQTRVR